MDERFLKEEGLEVFTGSELIVKGALEAEAALITGYPGSPVSEIFDVAYANRELLKSHGVLAELANNEALAVARVNGSRMAGVRSIAVMKSVGLHVAADGLALGNLAEPSNAGAGVIVVGDDPWMDSTQINNDSRYLSRHLHMPVVEPATFQEIKDWVGVAFELSSLSNLYITYLITTHQADGGGTVWTRPNRYPGVHTGAPITIDTARINLDAQVLLPPRTWTREATLPLRFERLVSEVRRRRLNELKGPEHSSTGFVASGLSYCYLEHALTELGLSGRFPILKLGMTYPLDPDAIFELAKRVETIYVVEEKRGFVESQIVQILHEARQESRITAMPTVWGKKFPNGRPGFPEMRGLTASIVAQTLLPLFLELAGTTPSLDAARLRAESEILQAVAQVDVRLPSRTPTFCPGCPHRDSSSVFLEIKKDFMNASYMKRRHKHAPVDLVFHGETGCFTMLMFEPNVPLMHNYSGMGLGGGTGAGANPFITNKQVVFLGDSTFFHSGMIAISDSLKNHQDITYVILDNKTTAMTGHQPTPGTDGNLMGEQTFVQSIEAIVKGMAGDQTPVFVTNPEFRDAYRDLLEETVLKDGVKVIIADKECGLTMHRRRRKDQKQVLRKQGYLSSEKHVNVTPEVCEFCLECTRLTGCPGLTIEQTLYGPKIATDLSDCVSDGACAKVNACPSFGEVLIKRKAPATNAPVLPPLENLPMPVRATFDRVWYAATASVGGMGAGFISAVLVEAAQRDGYRVLFSDKKGLAVRNGSVYAHIVLSQSGGALAPLVPQGKADLLFGIDLLEAARSLDAAAPLRVAHAARTAAVVNLASHHTVRMLMGDDVLPGPLCESMLRQHTRAFWGVDVSALSQYYFGSTLYANAVLLGAACQQGWLPISLDKLEAALAKIAPKEDRRINLQAFQAGRALVVSPEKFHQPQPIYTYASLLAEKTKFLAESSGIEIAKDYRFLVEETVLTLGMDDATHLNLAQRVYDLVQYENLKLAERYVQLVLRVAERDREPWHHAATQAVLRNAFKVMAIKDEVYVAHLLTSPEKHARDRARYRINEQNGDRLDYRHFNRPEFSLFGRTFRMDLVTRDWQLNLLKRMKFLRRALPNRHRAEREFRDWYLGMAERFEAGNESDYGRWVQIFESPAEVRGYREIRVPGMQRARKKSENLMRLMTEVGLGAPVEARW